MQAENTIEPNDQSFLFAVNIHGRIFETKQDVSPVIKYINAPFKEAQEEVKTAQPTLPVVSEILTTFFSAVKNAMAVPHRVIGKVRTIVATKDEPLPT